jgi:DNA-binding winged helix-turn-helix (wHTH) protein
MMNIMGPEDTLGLQFALQQAHEILVGGAGRHVVWLIDRFDEACARLEPSTLNSLRNIRDNHMLKGRLSYVVFTRYPLARIRHPRDYDEFHEIMVPNTCWVGPMVKRDATWMASQMADRHGVTFGEEAVELLFELSGGLPAFLKAACTALATGLLLPGESAYIWLDRILDQQAVLRNCQEMWDDLKPEEQSSLTAIAAGGDESQLDATALQYLEESRLLSPVTPSPQSRGGYRVFSMVFELFVLRQQLLIASGIALDPNTGALTVNDRALRTKLTPQENRLMAYLVKHQDEVCGKDLLIAHIWPEEDLHDEEQDGRLSQTIDSLRQKIEGNLETGELIVEVDGQGYRFQDPSKTVRLQIAVNEEKFQEQVQKIVETDFFRNLERQAHAMRKTRAGAG